MRTVLAIVASALIAAPALASAPIPDADEQWSSMPRDTELDVDRVAIAWSAHDAARNETITATWTLGTSTLEHVLDTENVTRTLRVHLRGLVEFQDLDRDGRLSLGDPIVRQVDLSEATTTTPRSEEGANVTAVTYSLRVGFPSYARAELRLLVPTGNTSELLPTEVGLELEVTSMSFASDNRTRLGLDVRIDEVLDRRGSSGILAKEPYVAYTHWREAAEGNVTFQAYGASGQEQTILVLDAQRETPHTHALKVGWAKREPLPAQLVDQDGLQGIEVTDWRLWTAGFLVTGMVIVVLVARRLSKGSPP